MSQSLKLIKIQYKQGQQFETDIGSILPSYIYVDIVDLVYDILVPAYCLDINNRIQNAIMWDLYPQFKNYDFASGQP